MFINFIIFNNDNIFTYKFINDLKYFFNVIKNINLKNKDLNFINNESVEICLNNCIEFSIKVFIKFQLELNIALQYVEVTFYK